MPFNRTQAVFLATTVHYRAHHPGSRAADPRVPHWLSPRPRICPYRCGLRLSRLRCNRSRCLVWDWHLDRWDGAFALLAYLAEGAAGFAGVSARAGSAAWRRYLGPRAAI